MKKTFPLQLPGKNPERVLESVKSDVRKYVRREQGKKLPEGFNRVIFACKVGKSAESAVEKALSDVVPSIDSTAKSGAPAVYVEILATPVHRPTADDRDS